jgi:hypothetical protein
MGAPYIYDISHLRVKQQVVTVVLIVGSSRISILKCGHTSGAAVQLVVPTTDDGTVTYVLPLLQLPGLCKCGLPWVLSNMFKSIHDICLYVYDYIS